MIPQDFYGKRPFIWWIGIVEDVLDPLKLGSVRVRIIGLHSEDKKLVPTNTLPWAQVALSTNAPNTYATPREGDWVLGFFQDGEFAQIPVVLNVLPGVESSQSSIVYQEAIRREGAASKPRSSQVDRVIGEPTQVRITRGVMDGTLTNAINQERKSVCDISPEVNKAVAYVRAKFGIIIEEIRKAIRAALKALGFSDTNGEVSKVIQFAKAIAREIKYITSIISELNDLAQILILFAMKIRALIDYILSLPEKARRFLQECLDKAYAALAKGFADLLTPPEGGSTIGDIAALQAEFNNIVQASRDLLAEAAETLAIPGQVVEALANPASPEAVNQVGQEVETFLLNTLPSKDDVLSDNTFVIEFKQH
jgi:hypothetical protein